MLKTNILIAEDHELFRKGVVALLKREGAVNIISEAADGLEAVRKAVSMKRGIVLMDVQLPLLNGIEASRKILSEQKNVRILALSQSCEEEEIRAMVQAGVHGYLLKDGSLHELITAIEALQNGHSYFSQAVSGKLFASLNRLQTATHTDRSSGPLAKLTRREQEILKFIAEELSNKEIAEKLYISTRTVETHKRNLIQKLQVKNTVGLVKLYLHSSRGYNYKSA